MNREYLIECIRAGIKYIPVTLKLTFVVFIVSLVIGLLIATVRFYKVPFISRILSAFVTIYRGIPVILALNIYYLIYLTSYTDVMSFFHLSANIKNSNPISVAYFALILANSCGISEIIRGAYNGIDKTQFEAGYAIGMNKFMTLRRIIWPQLLPIVLPNLINMLIGTLKNANTISVIGIVEIMKGSIVPCSKTYSFIEGYMAAALIYWALGFILEILGKFLEKNTIKYRVAKA